MRRRCSCGRGGRQGRVPEYSLQVLRVRRLPQADRGGPARSYRQTVWDTAGAQTLGPTTPFAVELTQLDGSTVRGPIKQSIVIAQATLKGSIYYDSYNSKLGGASWAAAALVGRRHRRRHPHQARQRRRVLRAQRHVHGLPRRLGQRRAHDRQGDRRQVAASGLVWRRRCGGHRRSGLQLMPDGTANPRLRAPQSARPSSGLSPDGSVYLTTAVGTASDPTWWAGVARGGARPRCTRPTPARSCPTRHPDGCRMPTFSAGRHACWPSATSPSRARRWSLMDFDAKARKASNARALYSSTAGHLGWPFLLPDNGGVIFAVTELGDLQRRGGTHRRHDDGGPSSDLSIADARRARA